MNPNKHTFTEGVATFSGPGFSASLLPRKDSGAVFVRMAVPAGEWYAKAGMDTIASAASSLLDEGTKSLSREDFRMSLERDGSTVSFWDDGRYLYAGINATTAALPKALSLAYDALSTPLISEESVKQVLERLAEASLHDSENTGVEAHSAFTRLLYTEDSAYYTPTSLENRQAYLSLKREGIVGFISDAYRGPITVAAIGDIAPESLEKILIEASSRWNSASGSAPRKVKTLSPGGIQEKILSIAGKESADVFVGGSVPLSAKSEETSALRLALDLLGGGFSDHLMQTVRDRDGLTYGTYARLEGREFGDSMHWFATATFGNALFEKGVNALKKELGVFLKSGITEKRLEEKREELEGRYAVLFADSQRASSPFLLGILATGTPHDIGEYMVKVRSLDAKEVQRVAEKYLKISAIAAAGSIDTKKNVP